MRAVGLLAAWFLSAGLVFGAGEIEFIASVDRTTMTMDDVLVYSVTARSSSRSSLPQPELPDFDGFQIVGGPSTSTQISMVNFQMTAATTTTLHLMATTTGDLVIKPAILQIDRQEYKTESLSIKVLPGSVSAPPQTQVQPSPGQQQQPDAQGSDDDQDIPLYVAAVADKQQVYVGEQIAVEYTLYNRASLANLNIQSLPGTSGFWVEDLESPQRLVANQTTIQGKRWEVALLKRLALFPNMSGPQTIEPMAVQAAVRVQRQRAPRQRRSPFDGFVDDFWGDAFAEVKNIVRRSPSIEIDVLPLPQAGRPASFNGAVGNYELTASLEKTEVQRGQAVTLRIVVSGVGNIKIAGNPQKPELEGFRVYDPTIEERSWVQGREYAGEKKLEYVLIPRKEGALTVPALEYSYFNPTTKSYQTKRTQPITLNVVRGPDQEPEDARHFVSSVDKQEVVIRTKDIRYIKGFAGHFEPQLERLSDSNLLWVWLVPLIVLPASYLITKQRVRYYADQGYARKKRAQTVALKWIKAAEQALKKNNTKDFYDALTNALVGFVADKLNLPKPSLTTETLMTLLHERKVPEERRVQLRNLLLQADIARFTPSGFDVRTMEEALTVANDWLAFMIKANFLEDTL